MIGLSTLPALTLAGAAVLGLTLVIANVASQTIWQAEVPDAVRGRVFATRIPEPAALWSDPSPGREVEGL